MNYSGHSLVAHLGSFLHSRGVAFSKDDVLIYIRSFGWLVYLVDAVQTGGAPINIHLYMDGCSLQGIRVISLSSQHS